MVQANAKLPEGIPVKYRYLAPQAHERYNGCLPHRVLTPDGGVIFCITEADANRICDDMNALCEYVFLIELYCPQRYLPNVMPEIEPLLTAFGVKR